MVAWAVATIALGLGSAVYPWLMLLAIGLTVLAGVWLMSIKCEKCGYPVDRREVSIGGARFSYWTPLPSRRCVKCGTGSDPDTGLDAARSARLKRIRVVLTFLIVVNLIGGIGLAQRVDERFVWVAIVIPLLCLALLLLTLIVSDRNTESR
jgi:hypothetical protein